MLTKIAKFQRTEEDSLCAIIPSKWSGKYYSFEVVNFLASELESTIKGILASYLILVRREDLCLTREFKVSLSYPNQIASIMPNVTLHILTGLHSLLGR